MATQIEQYRASFAKMSAAQKKAFIEKLRSQLVGKNNLEYSKFLNECIQKYKLEVSGTSAPNDAFGNSLNDLPSDSRTIAEPAQRFIAYLIDCLLLLPTYIFLYFEYDSLYWLNDWTNYRPRASSGAFINSIMAESQAKMIPELRIKVMLFALLVFVSSIIVLVIQIRYWKKGTSFGKNKQNLFVVNKDTGKTISIGYMFLREVFGKWISGMVFYLGFIWILLDKDKQAWHDKLVSSVVVKR